MTRIPLFISTFFISSSFFVACNTTETPKTDATATGAKPAGSEAPAYFNLRLKLEKKLRLFTCGENWQRS